LGVPAQAEKTGFRSTEWQGGGLVLPELVLFEEGVSEEAVQEAFRDIRLLATAQVRLVLRVAEDQDAFPTRSKTAKLG